MINRKTSSKKSSLRKTSNCSHISKIAARLDCDSLESSNNSQNSGSGCANPAFEIEPPIMYSNNTDAIVKLESTNDRNDSKISDSIDYAYYSKC